MVGIFHCESFGRRFQPTAQLAWCCVVGLSRVRQRWSGIEPEKACCRVCARSGRSRRELATAAAGKAESDGGKIESRRAVGPGLPFSGCVHSQDNSITRLFKAIAKDSTRVPGRKRQHVFSSPRALPGRGRPAGSSCRRAGPLACPGAPRGKAMPLAANMAEVHSKGTVLLPQTIEAHRAKAGP